MNTTKHAIWLKPRTEENIVCRCFTTPVVVRWGKLILSMSRKNNYDCQIFESLNHLRKK